MDKPSTFHMREYYALNLKAMILILQRIWRHYQAKIRKNTLSQWIMKSKVLWEGTHGRLFWGSQLLITKPRSNKPFQSFSYHMCAALSWSYRLFFHLRTTSCCPPSLMKSLGSSMKTGSPLGISAWAKAFVKSILWLWKPRIHCKININLTVAHWTTGEYEFRGLG